MSILNVNKINPVGGGSTVTIAGIASVTSSVTAPSFVGSVTGDVTGNVTGDATGLSGNPSINTTGIVTATSFVPTVGQLSHRNLIINGDMKISQRGTSFADPANGSYTLDRFDIQNSSGTPAFTVTQDTDAPHGFNNSLKVACTTADASPAAGSFSRIRHTIEAQNLQPLAKGTSSAKASTLSFYVKTNKTGVYTVFVYDDDNNRMFSASYTVSDTNWNRYTIIIPADTTGAINDDNGAGFVIHWGLSLGSNRTSGSLASNWATYSTANEHVGNVNFADNTSNVWAITGVQLEVGSVTTPFEHRSFGDELARCQRYFYRMQNGSSGSYWIGHTSSYGGNNNIMMIYLPVCMRDNPSFSTSGTASHFQVWGNSTVENLSNLPVLRSSNGVNPSVVAIDITHNITTGHTRIVRMGSQAYIEFSAEL